MLFYLHDLVRLCDSWERDQILYIFGSLIPNKVYFFQKANKQSKTLSWIEREKGTTEDEMVGWHHWLNRHEFEPAPRDSEGQGNVVCCSPLRHKESDTTENDKSFACFEP